MGCDYCGKIRSSHVTILPPHKEYLCSYNPHFVNTQQTSMAVSSVKQAALPKVLVVFTFPI